MDRVDAAPEPTAHAAMLQIAREARQMTQAELAEAMTKSARQGGTTVSQGYVSRAEAGRLEVTGERLGWYAAALGYPAAMLCLDPHAQGVGVGLVHHRKRAALSSTALRRIHADLALTRLQVSGLARAAGGREGFDVPRIQLDAKTTPADAAAAVRRRWGFTPGPVADLVAALEAAGVWVVRRDLGSSLLDAVSHWDGVQPPLVLVNSRAPADRSRFSLAHEIGHLVLHASPGPGPEQERQADAFASAFLMPAADIRTDLAGGVDLARLIALKCRWRVSMAALLRRARDLNAITEWSYRSTTIEMSTLGYRTVEPAPLSAELPKMIDQLVATAASAAGSLDELAACAHLLPEDFADRYVAQHAVAEGAGTLAHVPVVKARP